MERLGATLCCHQELGCPGKGDGVGVVAPVRVCWKTKVSLERA